MTYDPTSLDLPAILRDLASFAVDSVDESSGVPEELLIEVEQSWSMAIPGPLRAFYRTVGNLDEVMDRHYEQGRDVDSEMCAFIGSRVARALAHAHDKRSREGEPLNIVHRDVTPGNIMINYQGVVKLSDFFFGNIPSCNTGLICNYNKQIPSLLYIPAELEDPRHEADLLRSARITGIVIYYTVTVKKNSLFHGFHPIGQGSMHWRLRLPNYGSPVKCTAHIYKFFHISGLHLLEFSIALIVMSITLFMSNFVVSSIRL